MAGRKRTLPNTEPAQAKVSLPRRKPPELSHAHMPKKQRKIGPTGSVTTRGAKRKSLSDAVFLTTELLDNILAFLPMRDLLISQRVARKWRAVISDSNKLQQQLFMAPRDPDTAWEVTTEGGGEEQFISGIKTVAITGGRITGESENVHYVKHGELNPMIFEQVTDVRDLWDLFEAGGPTLFLLKDQFQRPRSQRFWMEQPEASWRKMLISQPPTKSFYYHFTCKSMSTPLRSDVVTWDSHTTVSGIMDKIHEIEHADKDAFSFGDHFMSLDDEHIMCPMDGE